MYAPCFHSIVVVVGYCPKQPQCFTLTLLQCVYVIVFLLEFPRACSNKLET